MLDSFEAEIINCDNPITNNVIIITPKYLLEFMHANILGNMSGNTVKNNL